MLYHSPRSVLNRVQRVRSIAVNAAVLALVAFSSACASGRTQFDNPFDATGPTSDEVVAQINNTSYFDVVVRAELAGVRHRLGTVRTGEARAFVVPRPIARASGFALVADPIGSRRVISTHTLYPAMGERVFWQVGETSYASHVRVR